MAKLKLMDPETDEEEVVNIIMRFRKAVEFEKENRDKDINIIKYLVGNAGSPNFEVMTQLLYIGYTGGMNKTKYTFTEFLDRLNYDFNSIMKSYGEMMNKKKN